MRSSEQVQQRIGSSFIRTGDYSFVTLHPNHPVRKESPKCLYAIRKADWEGVWDFAGDLVDDMEPLVSGTIWQAYSDKETALKALSSLTELEWRKPIDVPITHIYTGTTSE